MGNQWRSLYSTEINCKLLYPLISYTKIYGLADMINFHFPWYVNFGLESQ